MDRNLLGFRCTCTKCKQEEHHQNSRIHDLIARMAMVVPTQLMEGLIGAVLHHFKSQLSPLELHEIDDAVGIYQQRLLATYEVQLARADVQITFARSRSKEFARNAISASILEKIAYKWWLPVDEAQLIDLSINGRSYSVRIPNGDGTWALQEALFAKNYDHKLHSVDAIYDLGAFIGVSALVLNSIYPEAHITCIEPSPRNLVFLTDNLKSNLNNYRIIPAAVFDGPSEIGVAIDTEASMRNSVRWGRTEDRKCMIPTVSLTELVNTDSFGIKIDIEGAEFSLKSSADTFRAATWIMGELHFDELITPEDMWLIDMLQQEFVLELSFPRFAEIEGQYVVAQEFWACNRNMS